MKNITHFTCINKKHSEGSEFRNVTLPRSVMVKTPKYFALVENAIRTSGVYEDKNFKITLAPGSTLENETMRLAREKRERKALKKANQCK